MLLQLPLLQLPLLLLPLPLLRQEHSLLSSPMLLLLVLLPLLLER